MRLKGLWVLLLVILVVGAAFGQEDRGRINGLVTDPSEAVIPKATVTLLNEGTKVTRSTLSDSSGQYVFEFVIPGVYTVTATSPGFKQFAATHVRVEVAAHIGVPVKMQVGDQAEQVTVEGSGGARLRTEDSVLGFTVESRSANELPILYSNPFELQYLAPGVTSTSLSTGNHTYEGGSESTKIDGSQSGQTEFTLDGAPDTRNGGAVTTAYVPSRDFIGEFRLITSPYDASLSHTSGGSIDTSLKSGTQQFHGGASWFYQNPDVDAPTFSMGKTPAPGVSYNRESAEVNGPIVRKKLFFFAGYEHQHNAQPANTSTSTVPTDAEKNGDFSALLALNPKLITNTPTCVVNKVQKYAPAYNQYQIFNPFSTAPDPNCPGLFLRQPYPGNIITGGISPIAQKILSFYPKPTGSSVETSNGQNNFVSNVLNIDNYFSVATRLDYDLTERQKLFGHFIISKRVQPGKNAFYPGASGQTLTLKNKAGVLDYVNTLNDTTVLDMRYSLTRFTTVTSLDAKTDAVDLGLPADVLAGANPLAHGFPQVKITGFGTLGNSDPGYEADNIHDGQISIAKSLNRHQLKFGVEYRLYQANKADLTGEHLSISTGGSYTKGPDSNGVTSPIGQALASFEAGIVENTAMTLNAATANNTSYWSGYIQDDWKARPDLTLNLGLRYEYGSPVAERNNKSVAGFAFGTPSPIASQAIANYKAHASQAELALLPATGFNVNGGLLYEGTPGSPDHDLWVSQKMNFSPRVGFAYSPTPKLVVRGGFGIFYSHMGEYIQYGNPLGFTQTTNTVATLDNGQTFQATLANPFPNGLVQPSGSSNGLLQGVGSSISFFPQHPKTPYNERYSLGVQYALPGDIIFEADYVGSNGYHIIITRDYNPVANSYLSTSPVRDAAQNAINSTLTTTYPNPFQGIAVPGSSSLTGSSISGSQLVKPFPQFTGVTAKDPSGFSSYNALQLSLQKRFSHGYNMSVSYSRSKALDAISFLNAGDAKPWYGVSNGDYPNVLSVAGIYELPFGRGKPFFGNAHGFIGQAIHGFQVEGTYRIQSGQPITFNNAGTILAPGAKLSDIGNGPSQHNATQWFNTDAFVNAIPGSTYAKTYSSMLLVSNVRTFPLRFNNVRQDYQNLLNLGVMKKFTVFNDRVNMDVRAEAINALNHPVFSAPTSDPASTNFGLITGFGNSSRVLQFAVEGHF